MTGQGVPVNESTTRGAHRAPLTEMPQNVATGPERGARATNECLSTPPTSLTHGTADVVTGGAPAGRLAGWGQLRRGSSSE